MSELPKDLEGSIAVVGLASRFPGAENAERFWENLRNGVESVCFLSEDDARALGAPADDPDFVRAVSQPEGIDRFDALFFGINHREAELLDPQQRVFLETAWEALEDAGCEPAKAEGVIGVFAGATTSTYLIFNLLANPELARSGDPLQLMIGNIGDTLATRVSYKLDLKGPSYTVQSACSSSLVAVHNACQSLLSLECDMALAGGVSINVAQSAGYRYQRESIVSPDGHCRAFDARAQGTIFGSGAGVVVLKRIEDAVRDGDTIRAVIRGSAVNNDGGLKVGYTAPSVTGQAEVISEALGAAGVEAETISYIEAHGTGTRLGDPIEIQALTHAYSAETGRTGFCAIGSVKSNIGHLDIAAGVAGLIKAVLALEHREIPPTLNVEEPSPEIDWKASPVYLNTALAAWETDGAPRRAGVSSFGIGGTNAHVILEEAPPAEAAPTKRERHLLVLSARSEEALANAAERLAAHLERHPELSLGDVAWTLGTGRRVFAVRRFVTAQTIDEAVQALRSSAEHDDPLGRQWLEGKEIDWKAVYPGERRRRVPLPTYPFERQRYWIERKAVEVKATLEPARTYHPRPQLSVPFAPPRNPEEEALAGMWQELLGVAPVGIHDDFFELGGHSLLGTQVIARVRDAFGIDLGLDVLFDAPTVARLAAATVADGGALRTAPAVLAKLKIPRLPRDGRPLPLSFGQQRLWFIDRLQPGNPLYNEPRGLDVSGPLDVRALAASLSEVVRRHEVLRATFSEVRGEPVQTVSPAREISLPVIDLSVLPDGLRDTERDRISAAEARRSFDLEAGPLLRLLLLRLAPQEHAVVFNAHHIVTDGWSMGVLVREMGALYGGQPLPELPIQYADFAAWQREELAGERLAELLGWWRKELDGAPQVLPLPTDRPRPPVRMPRGGTVPLALRDDLAATGDATPFMVLMAAFQALLLRLTGARDLLVGFPVAGRTRPETEPLIGFFVNTLPLRGRPSPDATWSGLLDQVRTATLGALAHQDIPFERLLDELRVERDLGHTPLVQAVLALHNTPLPELSLSGLTITSREIHAGTAKFDLALSLTRTPGGLAGSFEYASDLFDAATIKRLGGQLRTLLQGTLAAPETRLADLPLLSEAQRHQLLLDWNDTAEEVVPRPLHRMFEERAVRHPDRIAVVYPEGSLTYGQLDRQANRLARRLLRERIGPEARVAILLDRSPAWVAAVLGVLKAGGAWVPLDPGLPGERLSFLITDSEAALVITEEWLRGSLSDTDAASPEIEVTPDHLAYVIYTSGSTGVPKGVAVTHRGLASLARSLADLLCIGAGGPGEGAEDRVLQFSSPSFDASVLEMTLAWHAGAELHLASREALLPGESLADLLRERGITSALLVPAALSVTTPGDFPRLRSLSVGGEHCPPELAERWSAGRRLVNAYGPTEVTIVATAGPYEPGSLRMTMGRPLANARALLLDPRGTELVAHGATGEVCIVGSGLARGYLGRPELTAQRFAPHPFASFPGERLYRTGDLARLLPDGRLEYVGRIDSQVKIRGFRIELGEIQAVLDRHPAVLESRVVVREGPAGDRRLVAYYVSADETRAEALKQHLRTHLPEYMVPAAIVPVPAWPVNTSGKVDLAALPAPEMRREDRGGQDEPRGETARAIARAWQEVLGVERIGSGDNFFDLGGHSLLMPRLHALLKETLGERGRALRLVDLFRFPTVAALAGFLHPAGTEPEALERSRDRALARHGALEQRDRRIAIVGMSGRFPGAGDLDRFWENLAAGVESIRRLTAEEIAGDPLATDPRHVPAVAMPDGYDCFDALFFGLSHREAELLDPQHRLFLEVAWEALEDAGHDPDRSEGGSSVGVFAGTALSTYLLHNLAHDEEVRRSADPMQVLIGNAPDSLATRVSYKLDLKGPSYTVQSACSTGLVAVHHACQSLLAGECDVALAGASSLPLGNLSGYLYQEASIVSPDGHCRAFDAGAGGTVFGGGVGVVVLKRLADAVAAGDTIRAMILGTAVNNDGSDKMGYTAPSVTGQAEVISEALAVAGVEPATITYVEAHGTGTPVGDPIEIAALSQVIPGPCAIGSVKTNVGHLDTAAGTAGLIKTALALERGQIPPSLHFRQPNPQIDFGGSLYVNTELAPWKANGKPRRAGVSSFGIGGTNAHVVLEEAPRPISSPSARKRHLLVVSARSEEALGTAMERLAPYLERHDLADIAWTLGTGRHVFPERGFFVCKDATLGQCETGRAEPGPRSVAFLFSGQGSQYAGMGLGLYEEEPVFRREIDRGSQILGMDLLGASDLSQTELAQPALFAFEYALARQWMAWGITPAALLGHSIGEYVAACLASVFSFDDALRLVALRGRLMQEMPPGAMLAVALPDHELALGSHLSIAAINEPGRSVVAGPFEAIEELERRLTEDGVGCRRLHTSHAFHSPMMEPVRERFAAEVAKVHLAAPRLPFISNVTGTWITDGQATDPSYWAQHLRAPVRFADGVAELLRHEGRVLLEVGPGNALATLARSQTDRVVASTRHPRETAEDGEVLLAALGRLWLAGVPIDWARLYPGERRRRVPLPTYPFERQRYWIEGGIEGEAPRPMKRVAKAGSIAEELRSLSEGVEDDPLAVARRLQALAEALRTPEGGATAPEVRPSGRARHARPRLTTAFIAPRDRTEARIAEIWQDLLGVDEVGVDDDFFALGGHSLLGTQLLSHLNRMFEVKLPIEALFEQPTVGGLAARVRNERTQGFEARLVATGVTQAPLSYAQERLWFLDRLQPGSAAYNVPAVLRLAGDLDVGALRRTFDEIVRRHGALRTTFAEVGGEPRQRVAPPGPVPLPVVDLSGLPEPVRERERERRLAEEAARPFDLARGPLLRLHLLRLDGRDHTLMVNIHHIATDGWSMGVLIQETTVLYEAFLRGLPPPLPEPPIQYVDFAAWQRRWLDGPALDAHLDYWRRELAGAPELVEIPADWPRPAVQSFRGDSFSFNLPDAVAEAVPTLARRSGATPFMVLLAGFQSLVHRLAAADDVLVGSPIANRNRVEIEGLIGLFVNTLIYRLRLRGEETFTAVLERVRATTLAGYSHQDLPFEVLVDSLGIPRSLAHNPLFQVMLVLQNAPSGELEAPGLTLMPADPPVAASKLDLTVYLFEKDGGLSGMLEYATDLYDEATLRRLLDHFGNLLAGAGAAPGRRVSDLVLLSEGEREQLLRWNDTAAAYPDACLQELLAAQAERSPDAVAVVSEEQRLTYAELHRAAGRLAAHLRTLGVGPEALVGIAAERSLEMVVGLLGILQAGGAYVPIDPAYPAERLAGMIEDAGVPVLLTQSHLLDRLTEHGARVVLLDREIPAAVADPVNVEPGHAAYAIFTSGSTGRPKGAVNSHRGIVNRLLWMQQQYGLAPDDRVLQKTPFSFDVSVWEFFWPLIVGARLVMARPGGHQDPAYLVETIAREGITTLHFVPSMLQVFIEQEGLERCASLRRVMASGEALPAELAKRFLARLPGVELHNLYGPTEAAVDVTYHACRHGEARVPIGRPVANTRIHLLDTVGQEAPVGVAGELCIGGVQVGRGYLKRSDLTADRFTPDPFGQPGSRFYRTGDLARWLPNGEVEYLGRIDYQVKIRGVRIELGEIEAALCRHPGVREAVVLTHGQGADRELVAYLVPPIAQGVAVLRDHLQASLPEAMVPAAFVFLDAMPLSPNGKADRKALARIAPEREAAAFVAPRTPFEARLADIWQELLRVERVGVEDHFFRLGGHSLMATRLVSRLRDTFGVELPLREVFEAPTLAGLAARIEVAGPVEDRVEAPVPAGAVEAPLSFAQERLWFLDRLQPGSAAYNIPTVLRLTGRLDVEALRRSFDEIVRRHGPLRTTFAEVLGKPRQQVSPAAPVLLPVVDLSGLPKSWRGQETARWLASEVARPFDLARGPLLRIHLLRQAPGEHTLVVVIHHIVSDGWSMGILVQETTVLYNAFLRSLPSPLPELPIQYADFAAWQRDWLRGEVLEGHLDHWRRELADAPALVEIPTDRPRPAVQSFRGTMYSFDLPDTLAEAVRTLARQAGATPFMVLLAGFQALLHRESGSDDVIVGSPIANRNRIEVEGLIGLFVNTLVFRLRLSGEDSFLDVLARVCAATLAGYAHQDLPFEVLVDALGIPRSLAHNPLFQVMLVLQNTPPGELRAPDLTLGLVEPPIATSKIDMTLTLIETGEGLTGGLEYATDLYDEATIRRLIVHLENLLAGAGADPGRRLSDLALLSEAERQQFLLWNDTAVGYPDLSLVELLGAQAERMPAAVAVVFEGERLTYAELHREAGRLAAHLRSLGVGPEVLVGIAAERSLEMVVGLLGILQAGGAYVPIDPGYPAERLAGMIEDAGVPVLLTQSHLLDRLPEHGAWVVLLDREIPSAISEPVQVEPGHAAYMIFTSGSTGRPKGAVNAHRGIVNRLLWMQQEYGLTPDDRVLQKTPFSFDVSVWEFFWPLIIGARLVVAKPGGHQDSAYLVEIIEREGITTLHFVPSMLQVFAEQPGLERLTSLRRVMASGEALPADLASRFLSRLGDLGVELHNLYGPTEAAVDVTYHACRPGEERVPIGRPIANTRIHLLDSMGQEVPIGVAGELCIGGVQVGRGYLNRPDLTADRFTPDPFGPPGARFYRTGDLARWLPDGEVEYLGRIDHQVKIRGVRIELCEIETALCRHPGVREAVVIAHGQGADRALAAYLVPQVPEGAAHLRDQLREHLQASLPEAMVPSAFVFLNAMPLSPNGKVDRKALPKPEATARAEYVAPRNLAEELLAAIWSGVLGIERVERVGAEDSFFELGGHSLLGTQVVSRVREELRVEMPLRAIFESPTLSALARRIEDLRRKAPAGGPPRIEPLSRERPRDGALEVSFSQQRLWFLDRLEPGRATYNIPLALRLEGSLDTGALESALHEIVHRHEALRTTFTAIDGRPYQLVHEPGPAGLPVCDLSGLEPEECAVESRRRITEEARTPFSLERGPLVRTTLLRLNDAEHVLLVTLHHIVSDGWSVPIYLREMTSLYEERTTGKPAMLPELPIQYSDFAHWQRRWLQGETLEAELAHWRERLQGLPPLLELTTDRPRPAVRSWRGATRRLSFEGGLVRSLHTTARRLGATPFMVMLSAFAALLHRYSSQESFAVGVPVAGRNRVEIEPLIGFFVNTLVLRCEVTGEMKVRALVERLRERVLDAHAHQDVPFEKLVEELSPGRSLSHSPLFQVMLAFQNLPREGLEPRELKVTPVDAASGMSKFDLTLSVIAGEDRMVFDLEHSTELFDGATLERLSGHLVRLLEGALVAPERQVADLPLLSPEEERQLVQWNETAVAYPVDVCLHELFEAQVKRSPERQAVTFEGRSLTYRELDRAADRLALRLQDAGTGPETVVGVLAERSLEMVVALLAVLKAGGAYLPLDPDYPADRLAFMIADSRMPVVLAQGRLLEELPVRETRVLPLAGAAEATAEVQRAGAKGIAESLAYVIYTSGSTGRPKGTMVPHRAVLNHMLWMQSAFPLEPSDRVLQKTSFSFDASVWEFLAPLFAGATLVMAPPGAQRDPAALARSIQGSGATILQVVPSLLRAMLDGGWLDECRSLRRVFCGGEELSEDLAADFFRVSEAELHNLYGPTETASETTFWTCERDGWRGPVPIGRPVANTRLHIVDPRLRPVPAGVPGELLVGGVQVTRGYLARPEVTAERFVPDPFSGEPGARLYRTGDLVKRRPDGAVEFLGRVDFQVKIRGFRIELGEVESALLAIPGVAEAVVLALGEGADKRLVAYVSGPRSSEEIRASLKARLPAFLVPSGIVVLDALPLSPNGKVDRKALARIEPPAAGERELAAPRTPAEEMLSGIWGELLGLERVGPEDQFFELGGHSLLATRLASRVREVFGVELPLREIFEAPTPAGVAERIAAIRLRGGLAAPPLVPGMGEERFRARLSYAQERLWFLDRLQPGSAFYNVPSALRLSGALDPAVFAAALDEIVRRHDALRTTFTDVGGEPWQVVAPELAVPLPVIDLSSLPAEMRDTEARRQLVQEAARSFDLELGPLLRAVLVRLAGEEHVAVLTLHHIVADGWSVDVLVRELAALTIAALTGRAARLPDLPVQYVDFARWQREWLVGEVLDEQIGHWKEALRGAPTVLELPADRPRPPVQTFRGAGVALALPAELTAALRDLGRRQGVTLFMALLGGFEALLARYTGEEDLLVGSPVANRNRGETEGLIGFFVNNLVLRADLRGDPGFAGVLGRVRANALAAYERQDLPFERLVEELGVERSLARNPLFQVVFSLQNAPEERFELPGLTLAPIDLDSTTAKTDLLLALAETADGDLRGVWEYAADLFDRTRIERMAGHLLVLLEAAAADPSLRVSDLPLLTAAERQQLQEWNALATHAGETPALPILFAERAAEAPDRTAVVFGDESISYSELAKRSGRLARQLAKLGVGPETRVGIAAEPGLDRVIAVLAVWMAGGAYMPLDASYPKERLAFMLEDAGAPVLLTESRLLDSLPPYTGKVVPLDAPIRGRGRTGPLPRVTPDHLAYVIYTSGSTGRPNGVLVRHGSAARLIHEAIGHFQVGPESRVLQSVSFSFDASVLETWLALASGATLVIAPRTALLSGEALAETIDRHGITTAVLTPAVLANLPEDGLPTLVTASVGGDSCLGELATRWSRRLRLLNCYGPTEATIYATVLHLEGTFAKEPPIGRPVGGTEVYLLDRSGQPVPGGVPGELCIAGDGLARGYLNRSDLTAQRLIPYQDGERLYRTGDLARYLADGNLEFLGRVDHQVKLRGLRIELGEIEAALARHPAVRECAAAVRGSGSDRRLIAWVVFRDATAPAADLRAFLRERLPEHMLPAAFVTLEALPLSPTGKVDRAALPDPQADTADRIAPRDPLEHELATIWEETLGVGPIGVRDDFFALGGHSLLAVRLMSKIEERLGRALPLTALFTAGTVEGMAALLREEKAEGTLSILIPLQPRGERPPFFWVHPAGGDVLCYVALARHLGLHQPFYGIQARSEEPPSRIEEMSALYVQEIRRVQPEGPYYLGGWSLGGAVAFEMARQLRAAGQIVGLLTVLDGAPVVEASGPEESDADFLLDIAAYVGNFHGRDPKVSRERLEALGPDEQIAYLTERLAAIDFLPPGSGEVQLRRVLAVYRANARAARRYRPGSYPDGLVLLRAEETPHAEADLGWQRVVGGPVEIHTVPGNHLTLLAEPNVQALAARLRLSLEQAFAGEMETVFE